jgi:hypothetical protein
MSWTTSFINFLKGTIYFVSQVFSSIAGFVLTITVIWMTGELLGGGLMGYAQGLAVDATLTSLVIGIVHVTTSETLKWWHKTGAILFGTPVVFALSLVVYAVIRVQNMMSSEHMTFNEAFASLGISPVDIVNYRSEVTVFCMIMFAAFVGFQKSKKHTLSEAEKVKLLEDMKTDYEIAEAKRKYGALNTASTIKAVGGAILAGMGKKNTIDLNVTAQDASTELDNQDSANTDRAEEVTPPSDQGTQRPARVRKPASQRSRQASKATGDIGAPPPPPTADDESREPSRPRRVQGVSPFSGGVDSFLAAIPERGSTHISTSYEQDDDGDPDKIEELFPRGARPVRHTSTSVPAANPTTVRPS